MQQQAVDHQSTDRYKTVESSVTIRVNQADIQKRQAGAETLGTGSQDGNSDKLQQTNIELKKQIQQLQAKLDDNQYEQDRQNKKTKSEMVEKDAEIKRLIQERNELQTYKRDILLKNDEIESLKATLSSQGLQIKAHPDSQRLK